MAFWCKKRILSVLLLLLEISFVLAKIGGSNRLYLVASFRLSAIGFVTTIYTSFFRSTVPAVTRSESERQLIAVEIVVSFILLVFTYIQLIREFLGAKSSSSSSNNNNNESLLPLAFAVISVVFIFRYNEEAQLVSDSESVSLIISTETPAFFDESANRRVPITLRECTTSTQSNNEEAQVVSDSESVRLIISPETQPFVDESANRRVKSTLRRRRNIQLHNIERKKHKMAVDNVGGAVQGAVFGEVVYTDAIPKAFKFKLVLEEQKSTLKSITPTLREIEKLDRDLDIPGRMIKGAKCVHERAKSTTEMITSKSKKEIIKGTAKWRKKMIKGAKLVLK